MGDAGLRFLLDAVVRLPLRKQFADSLEHPDPLPLALLPPGGGNLAVPANSNVGSGCSLHRVVKFLSWLTILVRKWLDVVVLCDA